MNKENTIPKERIQRTPLKVSAIPMNKYSILNQKDGYSLRIQSMTKGQSPKNIANGVSWQNAVACFKDLGITLCGQESTRKVMDDKPVFHDRDTSLTMRWQNTSFSNKDLTSS